MSNWLFTKLSYDRPRIHPAHPNGQTNMFRSASENNIDLYADSVSVFIKKCIGDVVPTVTIKTYLNQKPWMDGGICAKLKARSIAFSHGKRSENISEYKPCSYTSARQSKKRNAITGTGWSRNSTAETRDICGRVYRKSRTTKRNPATSRTPTLHFQTN